MTRAKDPRKTALAQERSKSKMVLTHGKEKNMKYRPKATPEQQSMAGRAGKLLGRAGAFQQRKGGKRSGGDEGEKRTDGEFPTEMKRPEEFVFEGQRASIRDGKPKDMKFGKKKGKAKAGKPTHRGAKRAGEWKKKQQK